MKKNMTLALVMVLAFSLAACHAEAGTLSVGKLEIPEEARSLVESYLDAQKTGVHESVKCVHFEDDWTENIYLDTNDKLLDYRIENAEPINNDLTAFTIMVRTMVSDETGRTHGEGTYEAVYNFAARIND